MAAMSDTAWCQSLPRRFIRFHLSSVMSAVAVVAVVSGLIRALVVARDESLQRVWPPLTRRFPIATSGDQRVQVSRGLFGTLICETVSGEMLFTVELLGHPIDGRLYAINRGAAPPDGPRWQRWNERAGQWESAVEGLLLKLANVARALVKPVALALVLSCLITYWLRRISWIRGVVAGLAAATVILTGLSLVPNAWQGGNFENAALNKDGTLLATASQNGPDSTVCLWNVSTGHGLARIELTNVHVDALGFSPNGNKLEVRNGGTVIRVWPLSAEGAR